MADLKGPPMTQIFPHSDALSFLLVNAARRLAAHVNAQLREKHKITLAEWRVLTTVLHNDKIRPTDVAHITMLDAVKVSRAIQVLIQRKLVSTKKDATDGRAVLLSLTALGTRTAVDASATVEAAEKALAAAGSTGARAALVSGLLDLSAALALADGGEDAGMPG